MQSSVTFVAFMQYNPEPVCHIHTNTETRDSEFGRLHLSLEKRLFFSVLFQVHLCEAEGLPDFNGSSSFHKKQLVIVKSLWRGCGDAKR